MKESEVAKNNVENLKEYPKKYFGVRAKDIGKEIIKEHLTTLQRLSKFLDDNFVYGYGCKCDFCQNKQRISFEMIRDIQKAISIYGGAGIE